MVRLATLDFQEAKRIRSLLEGRGVAVTLVADPSCASGACKPTVELHAREEDVPKIVELFGQERDRAFAGLSFDPTALDEVFDPSKETARCPACTTEFSTKATECPDCGLGFGGAPDGA